MFLLKITAILQKKSILMNIAEMIQNQQNLSKQAHVSNLLEHLCLARALEDFTILVKGVCLIAIDRIVPGHDDPQIAV
jgi:hypothetical protein